MGFMGRVDYQQYFVFLAVLTANVWPLGAYLARVFTYDRTFVDPLVVPIERLIVRLIGPEADRSMKWQEYFLAFISFGIAGEATMSYCSQIVALGAQNFLAAAAGLGVGIAFIRGIATDGGGMLGNFWRDIVRAVLWVLLPLSIPGALLLVWQGVPMNFNPYTAVTTLQGGSQVIAQRPVAAFEIIKNLGTNGGGFFNVNGAHPYENPTALSNFIEMLAIVVLPAAFCHTFWFDDGSSTPRLVALRGDDAALFGRSRRGAPRRKCGEPGARTCRGASRLCRG
jgi:K+-transporting ATPase ATPase A chain